MGRKMKNSFFSEDVLKTPEGPLLPGPVSPPQHRLDKMQTQIELLQEEIHKIYSKVLRWLSQAQIKIESLPKAGGMKEGRARPAMEDSDQIFALLKNCTKLIEQHNKELKMLSERISKNESYMQNLLDQRRVQSAHSEMVEKTKL